MKELLRTNDVVLLSFLDVRLREVGIEPVILDFNASIVEGSLGILPRRLMVIDDDYAHAVEIVAEVENQAKLSDDDG